MKPTSTVAGIVLVAASCVAASCTERPSAESASSPAGPASGSKDSAAARTATTPEAPTAENAKPGGVRGPQIAGSWYPGDRSWLVAEAQRMLRAARRAPPLAHKPVALIVPHAGWRYSGAAAAAAFHTLHRGDFARVVLLGPAHESAFEGYSVAGVASYRTPLGSIPVCPAAAALRDGRVVRDVPDAERGEHSLEIELPFLQQTLGSFCLVPILVGVTTPDMERMLATKLAALHNASTLFVVSSDFVHYGARFDYTPYGPSAIAAKSRIFSLENQAIDRLRAKDAGGFRRLMQSSGATICGRRGQQVLLELLPKIAPDAHAVLLAHYSSSDLPNPDDSGSVGYVALAFVEGAPSAAPAPPMGAPAPPKPCASNAPPLDAAAGRQLVAIARATLKTELAGSDDLGRRLAALPPSPRLDCESAVFVTLGKNGRLRGCVGQVTAKYPLPEAVVRSAVDAALHDTRFEPVSRNELGKLSYEVTVLSAPRPVASWHDIVVGWHGVILTKGDRRALFLPQVAVEQRWTIEPMLEALSEKAGLPADAWRAPDARFSVFTGQVFSETSTPSKGGKR